MKASVSAAERIPDAVTELIRAKHVFLAACAYTVENHSKDQTINFTQPITTQTYGLLVAKPKPLSRALLFTSPYSNEVNPNIGQRKKKKKEILINIKIRMQLIFTKFFFIIQSRLGRVLHQQL